MTNRLHLLTVVEVGDELSSAPNCEGQALLGLLKGGESVLLAVELVTMAALEAVGGDEVEVEPGVWDEEVEGEDEEVEGEDEFGDPCCDLWYFLTR